MMAVEVAGVRLEEVRLGLRRRRARRLESVPPRWIVTEEPGVGWLVTDTGGARSFFASGSIEEIAERIAAEESR